MKIRIILTKGDPIVVTEEQARTIALSEEPLVFITKNGVWEGDVIHKSHIVQMTRDWEAEREELLKNPRIEEREGTPMTNIKKFKPKWMDDIPTGGSIDP